MNKPLLLLILSCAGQVQAQLLNPQSKARQLQNYPYFSIIFASPSPRDAASMFGHTFLVAHYNEIPEGDAPTVELLGEPDAPGASMTKGLLATIPGHFVFNNYFQKEYEYHLEGRDLWLYRLRVNYSERAYLASLMRTRMDRNFSYNFLSTNCAYYIHKLLCDSLSGLSCDLGLYSLPIDSVRSLDFDHKIQVSDYIPSQMQPKPAPPNPLLFRRERYISLALYPQLQGAELRFRPVLRDFDSTLRDAAQTSYLEMMSGSLYFNKRRFLIKSFTLFNKLSLLPPTTSQHSYVSYIDLKYDDWSYLNQGKFQETNLRLGSGWAGEIGSSMRWGLVPYVGMRLSHSNSHPYRLLSDIGLRVILMAWLNSTRRLAIEYNPILEKSAGYSSLFRLSAIVYETPQYNLGVHILTLSQDFSKTKYNLLLNYFF